MEINLYRSQDSLAVDRYGADGFQVSGQSYSTAIMLRADACQAWHPSHPLSLDCFAAASDFLQGCDVVLLGSGAKAAFLAPSMRAALKDMGLSVEVMDTGAACRTYNVLLGDGRKVGALLVPPA